MGINVLGSHWPLGYGIAESEISLKGVAMKDRSACCVCTPILFIPIDPYHDPYLISPSNILIVSLPALK